MIYVFILVACAAFGWLYLTQVGVDPRHKYLLSLPLAIILAIPPAFRFRTGWDWEAYDIMYAKISLAQVGHLSGDLLFDLLLLVSRILGVSPYIVPAFIIVLVFFLCAVRRAVSDFAIPLAAVFFLWYGYFAAWSTIRQGIAISVLSLAFLGIRPKVAWMFAISAVLFHKSALLVVLLWAASRLLQSMSPKARVVIGTAFLLVVAYLRSVDILTLVERFNLLPLLGEGRSLSFGAREFLMAPYPLFTGRMVELLASLLVLSLLALRRTALHEERASRFRFKERRWITVLVGLQVQHLIIYLACSPITVFAERMVLYYDFIHCIAVGSALVGIVYLVSELLRPRRLSMPGTRVLLASSLLFSLYYIGNRYYNIFHAESREVGELTHAQRFFPYRSIFE